MLERVASKSSAALRSIRGSLILFLVVALAAIVWAAYVVIRLRVSYETQFAVVAMAAEIESMKSDQKRLHTEITDRLDELEQTVIGDILVKVKQPTPHVTSAVALWQRQRDAAIQKRLQELEWFRFRMESRLDK